MSYNLTLTNGSSLVSLADGSSDTSTTSIALIGKNYAGYGTFLNENFIKMLENFSSATPPSNPLQGQLWWDSTAKTLNVYQGTTWKVTSSSTSSTSAPTNPVIGDFWWDSTNVQLKVYSGSNWIAIGPTNPPNIPTTAFSANIAYEGITPHTVGNLLVGNKLVAVASADTSYIPTNTSTIGGLTKVNPGLNFPTESTIITTPNMTFGVTNGNVQFTSNLSYGFNFVSNVGGTLTNSLFVSGATGLITVAGNPTTSLGIATKGYVDTANTQMKSYVDSTVTTANVAMKSYVDTQVSSPSGAVATANAQMKSYVDNTVTTANVGMKSYVDYQISNITGGGGTTVFTSSVVPSANLTYDLGSNSAWWNNIYGTAIHAKYADLAERFHADQIYSPGTVVELGGSAEIMAASQDLSETVFGVISTNAAYLMNSGAGSDATHPPVAVQGRVPVKVIGRIRKGDRLVSAGNGLARAGARNEITSWNVIGRALEDKLDSSEGIIEAVVKLNS